MQRGPGDSLVVRRGGARESPRCPYCRLAVGSLELGWRCPDCDTGHHRECADENGGCTVFGCGRRLDTEPAISPEENARAVREWVESNRRRHTAEWREHARWAGRRKRWAWLRHHGPRTLFKVVFALLIAIVAGGFVLQESRSIAAAAVAFVVIFALGALVQDSDDSSD